MIVSRDFAILPMYIPVLQADYLADGAQARRTAFAQDLKAILKMADALKIFDKMEQKQKALICAQFSS